MHCCIEPTCFQDVNCIFEDVSSISFCRMPYMSVVIESGLFSSCGFNECMHGVMAVVPLNTYNGGNGNLAEIKSTRNH